MWPFSKKPSFLGVEVPNEPPGRVGELRAMYSRSVKGALAFEGPFPLFNEQGMYLCKSCGVPFDTWNVPSAINSLREAVLSSKPQLSMFIVTCRKCMTSVVFSAKDVVTGHQGDSTGPWTADEIAMAETGLRTLFKLSPAEIARIDPSTLFKVFYLYR